MNLEKQKENVNVLLQLIKENPELPIVPMVATECVFDDSHGYWMAEWSKAKIDKYCVNDDRIYSYNEEFDELVDDWIDENFESYERLTDDELRALAENKINNYDWEEAIIVYIENL